MAVTRAALGWPHEPFVVPEALRSQWDQRARGAEAECRWRRLLERYDAAFPLLAHEFDRRISGVPPPSWSELAREALEAAHGQRAAQAIGQSSQAVLDRLGPALPELIGGSADLTPSNHTLFKGAHTIAREGGDDLHYGVREFGMTAIMNALALHGGFLPYGGTFLVFSDYARSAVRMAALMNLPVVLLYTHDSIALGGGWADAPTDRTSDESAGTAEHSAVAPLRCVRDRGRLDGGDRARRSAW